MEFISKKTLERATLAIWLASIAIPLTTAGVFINKYRSTKRDLIRYMHHCDWYRQVEFEHEGIVNHGQALSGQGSSVFKFPDTEEGKDLRRMYQRTTRTLNDIWYTQRQLEQKHGFERSIPPYEDL